MAIKSSYAKLDDIPEAYRDLYEERGGEYKLVHIEGIVTTADVARVQRALDSEKEAHRQLKSQWTGFFAERKPDEVQAVLDKVPELEAAAKGKLDEAQLDGIVEGRIRSRIAPVERERDTLKRERDELKASVEGFQHKERVRTIQDHVRREASGLKVVDSALDDILMLAEARMEVGEDGVVISKDLPGQTPGLDPKAWLTELQPKRPHWWPASGGSGAPGSRGGAGGDNPWSAANWNLTRQGEIIRSQGMERAQALAKSAGSAVGATHPAAPAK